MPSATLNEISRNTEHVNREIKKINRTAEPIASLNNQEILHANPYEEHFHSEFCFISFLMGLLGLILPLFSVLAIIFGIAGLMQTHREHMQGRWMAVTGIVLGFLGILMILAAVIFNISFLETYLMKFGGIESLMGNVVLEI